MKLTTIEPHINAVLHESHTLFESTAQCPAVAVHETFEQRMKAALLDVQVDARAEKQLANQTKNILGILHDVQLNAVPDTQAIQQQIEKRLLVAQVAQAHSEKQIGEQL